MTCFDGRQYHRRGVSMALLCVHSLRIIDTVKIIGQRSSHGTVENCVARAIDDVNSSCSSEDLRRVVMMMKTSKATKRQ